MPPLHETIQDFPSGVRIADVTIGKRDVVGVTTSPWSRKRGVQVFPGQQWAASLRFLAMERDEAVIDCEGRCGMSFARRNPLG